MNDIKLITLSLLALILVLVACGGDSLTDESDDGMPVTGNASRGEELYKQTSIGPASAPGCITCHSL